MLAEIFFLKLETLLRENTAKPATARDPRFVPIALPRK